MRKNKNIIIWIIATILVISLIIILIIVNRQNNKPYPSKNPKPNKNPTPSKNSTSSVPIPPVPTNNYPGMFDYIGGKMYKRSGNTITPLDNPFFNIGGFEAAAEFTF